MREKDSDGFVRLIPKRVRCNSLHLAFFFFLTCCHCDFSGPLGACVASIPGSPSSSTSDIPRLFTTSHAFHISAPQRGLGAVLGKERTPRPPPPRDHRALKINSSLAFFFFFFWQPKLSRTFRKFRQKPVKKLKVLRPPR